MRSFEAAGEFVLEAIGMDPAMSAQPETISTTRVEYMDGMTSLTGHLAMPSSGWIRPLPAVIILPDWDGVNTYEQERATALAELGYVAMAADMFGSDKQTVDVIDDRIAEISKFQADPSMFVSRVQAAIDQIKMLGDEVDTEEIAIIGYCFGGTVSWQYRVTSRYHAGNLFSNHSKPILTHRELLPTVC